MATHVTLALDSAAFFQNLQKGEHYPKLEIGFFGSTGDAAEIHVIADGKMMPVKQSKLGTGYIEVIFKKANGVNSGIEVTDALIETLLRKEDLYPGPGNSPDFNMAEFDCTFIFTSGRFCCSMVKVRPFAEWSALTGLKTGQKHPFTKPISHNVAVHFELENGDSLQMIRQDGTELFTTANLPKGARRVDVDIVADNSTAPKFFKKALILKDKAAYWLPNQGDPPPVGLP